MHALRDLPPLIARLPDAARTRLQREAVPVSMPAGAILFRPGDACSLYLLLTAGTVRVQLFARDGHQIVLYRVRRGESCVLTTSCLLAHERYAAEGIAETEISGLGIGPNLFDALLGGSPAFRAAVFADFGQRLADLMVLLDEVAFRRIDARLADWLLSAMDREGPTLRHTHRAIAAELGTAREVVSRQLKELERQGLLATARGRIELRDAPGLRQIAATGDRSGRR